MSPFRIQLASVLGVLEIDPPDRFFWYGRPYEGSPWPKQTPLTDRPRTSLLTYAIHDHLYRHFYCWGTPVPYANDWDIAFVGREEIFAQALSEANLGRGYWDRGWRCRVGSSTHFEISKGLLVITAPNHAVRTPERVPIRADDVVWLRQPKESFHRSPGYYVAFGDEPLVDERGTVRIYWNVDPAGALILMRILTSRLNHEAVPFQLKALDNPSSYGRCDALVLYLPQDQYRSFRNAVAPEALTAVQGRIKEAVPAFTKRIASGVGVAEDPQQARSFGSHRCLLLAEALVNAAGLHLTSDESAVFVEDHFRSAGVNPDLPYLSTSSCDGYDDVVVEKPGTRGRAAGHRRSSAIGDSGDFLQMARAIGMSLVKSAIWHGDRCNWNGALGTASPTAPGARIGSMGCDVYGGTSGIAWFLAELFATTGDEVFRHGALGAMRRSLSDTSGAHHLGGGFYTGMLGTAAVAARLAGLLECEDLADQGAALGRSCDPMSTEFDLMCGGAGLIVGYLLLQQVIDDHEFLDRALTAGERVVTSARPSTGGLSWASPSLPGRRPLTGFSHGAAGVAYALLKLFEVSGQTDYRTAAEAAIAYERSWFDAQAMNWPDFREVPDGPALTTRVPYATTWCHGAPGIALSRICAAEVLSVEPYGGEAAAALTTTQDHLDGWAEGGRGNYSLCHGIAGNADVLLAGQRSRIDFGLGSSDVVRDVANLGLERHGKDVASWPCGVRGGENPSLMLGLAGIGFFYLRMATDNMPSALAPLGDQNWGQGAHAVG